MILNKEIRIIAEQAKIFQDCLLKINKIAKDKDIELQSKMAAQAIESEKEEQPAEA